MDELNRTHQEGPGTGTDRSEAQPALPFELPLEAPLPFDDEADRPVDLALTARARRAVAPADTPALRLVTGTPETGTSLPRPASSERDAAAFDAPTAGSGSPGVRTDEDPSDTRPSRARALRRAGRTPSRIAQQLGVDELLVRAWVADVAPRRDRRRSGGATGEDRTMAHAAATAAPHVSVQPGQPEGSRAEVVDDHRTAFELARATAREEARRERLRDPDFAGGIGLLAGIAEVDPHAVTITSVDADVSVTALRWIRRQLAIAPERVRVVLRIGPRVAGDLAAHRWAKVLEVPRERVAVASWRHAPTDDAEQVLLRIADPTAAATIAGWRDALLAPPGDDPADVAF